MLVVPDKMSREKIFNLRAMGAEVVLTRSDVAKGHPEYYQDIGARLAKRARRLLHQPVRQSGQPERARDGTGPEILEQMDGRRRRGRRRLRLERHDDRPVAVLPRAAARGRAHPRRPGRLDPRDQVNEGSYGKAGSWLVEGIGEDFLPEICDFSMCRRPTAFRTTSALPSRARCCARRACSAAPRPARCWRRRCTTAASRRRRSAS